MLRRRWNYLATYIQPLEKAMPSGFSSGADILAVVEMYDRLLAENFNTWLPCMPEQSN